MNDGVERLREIFPWPEKRPHLEECWHGWFSQDHERLLSRYLSADTKLVVELGSWMGLSTRFLCVAAPNAAVVAIDHWAGSQEHFADPQLAALVPGSYDQFIANMWPLRDRVVPVRLTTKLGMQLVKSLELEPDLVYVDAAHDTNSVLEDLYGATIYFPGAKIVGDDWNWPTVRLAVQTFAYENVYDIENEGIAWALKRSET